MWRVRYRRNLTYKTNKRILAPKPIEAIVMSDNYSPRRGGVVMVITNRDQRMVEMIDITIWGLPGLT